MKNYILTGLSVIALSASFTASASDMECSLWPVERYAPSGISAGQRAIDCAAEKLGVRTEQVKVISINDEDETIIIQVIYSDSTAFYTITDSAVLGDWV